MGRTNPLYVVFYFIADLGAISWLLYALTDELPHAILGLEDGTGTLLYVFIAIIGILSLGATIQKLDQ